MFKFLKFLSGKKIISPIYEVISLDNWDRLKKLPDTYLYDIIRAAELENIAIALSHSDQKMIDRFLECSELFHKEEKLKQLLDETKVSKKTSDKMKAHLVNLSGLDDPFRIQYKPYESY